MALRSFLKSGRIAKDLRNVDRLLQSASVRDRHAGLLLAREAAATARSGLAPRDPVRRQALLHLSFALAQVDDPETLNVLTELMQNAKGGDEADALDASAFNNMGALLARNGEHDPALRHFFPALEIKRRLFGSQSKELLPLLQDMLQSADNLGDASLQLELAEDIHRIMSCYLSPDDPVLAPAIANLETARAMVERAGPIRSETKGAEGDEDETEDADEASRVDEEAEAIIAAFERGAFEHARALHFNWLEKHTQTHSGGHFLTAFIHDFVDPILAWAMEQDGLGQDAEGRADFESAIGYFRQVEAVMLCYPSRPDRLAAAKSNLARVLGKALRFESALALSREALVLAESLGAEDAIYKGVLGNHVELYMAIAEAEAPDPRRGMPALGDRPDDFKVRLRVRLPMPIDGESPVSAAARQLDARAAFYQSLTDFTRERRLLELASDLWRLEAKGRAEVLMPSLLALIRHDIGHGRPDRAQPLLEEALSFPADSIDPRSWLFLRLHSLELALNLNRRDAAHSVVEQLKLFAARPDVSAAVRRVALENAAIGLSKLGDVDSAQPIFAEILAEAGEAEDASASELAQLAQYATALGYHANAERWLERAMKLWRQETGEWTADYAVALSNAATLARYRGDWRASIERHERALQIRSELFGPHHSQVLASSLRLIFCLGAIGEHTRALDIALGALETAGTILGRSSAMSSEREFLSMIGRHQTVLAMALSLVDGAPDERRDAVLTALLRQKGQAAYSLFTRRNAVLTGRYPHLKPQLDELHELQSLVAAATLAGAESVETLKEAAQRRADLEAELARAIPEMAIDVQLAVATTSAVAAALQPDEMLAEVARYEKIDWDRMRGNPRSDEAQGELRYVAFLLGREGHAQFLDLGPASAIEEDVARAVAHFGEGADDRGAVGRLSAGLAQPILSAARRSGAERLYFAPDGEIWLLPLDAIPADDGKPLMEHLDVVHLAVGRDLLRPPPAAGRPLAPPLILAAPAYAFEAPHETPRAADDEWSAQVGAMRLRMQFQPLDGTAREGEAIRSLFPSASLVTGRAATRSSLEQAARPLFLHLATHGYFHKGRDERITSIDPMLRSGLALAGANLAWRTGDARIYDESYLTAASVATLDLLETDLVTLSACESGVGETLGGEGVFGLRRAFTIAGARTIVMSLWKVGDRATAELMVDFYRGLAAGLGKSRALREAKRALRERGSSVRDWGAFVIEGDISPLRAANPS